MLAWRIFQDRVATKTNLDRRGVISQENIRCLVVVERKKQRRIIFFECPIFTGIWNKVCNRFRLKIVLPNDNLAHFDQFRGIINIGNTDSHRIVVVWFGLLVFGAYGNQEMESCFVMLIFVWKK